MVTRRSVEVKHVNDEYNLLSEIISTNTNKLVGSISEVFDLLKISDGMCLSFHHHLVMVI